MQIYTRTGDKGFTSLVGGQRVSKDDDRVKAQGTIDELNSALGVLGALIEDKALKQELEQIQQLLFDCGMILRHQRVRQFIG